MKKHILVVHHDEYDITVLTRALDRLHLSFKCTWAATGEQAMSQLSYLTPDIIFLDILMPGMDGFDCLDIIKTDDRLKHIPVILHSSILSDDLRAMSASFGAAACLSKPGTMEELAVIVSKFLSDEPVENSE